MMIKTDKGVWLDRLCKSSEIQWLLNSSESAQKNIRSSTELKSWRLSMYLVDTGLIGIDNSRLKPSAISLSISEYIKW